MDRARSWRSSRPRWRICRRFWWTHTSIAGTPRTHGPYFWWGRNPAKGPDNFCLGHLDAIKGGLAAASFFANHPEFYNAATSSYTDANAYLVFSVGPDGQPEVLNPDLPVPDLSVTILPTAS